MHRRLADVPWHALEKEAALPAIAAALSGAPAERELERVLKAHRAWSREQRRAAAEAIFGVALWRRRLAWHARSDDPCALLDVLIRNPEEAPERLAERWSLPDWLEAVLIAELGPAAEAFCEAIAEPGPVCLRANRLLDTREELAARLPFETHPAARARDALVVDTPQANLFGCDAWREGRFEVQDEGSQLLGELVEAQPGETVLDLCAGAGGKSLLLAAQGAHVFAYDIDEEKLTQLRARARRAQAERHIDVVAQPRAADRVLVDAPCSELGALRRGPDMRWRLQPDPTLPATQGALLETAAPLARKRLVYATCTLARAENEAVAEAFEAAHGEFRRARPFWRTLPHTDGTDGFFAAIWDRT